MTLENKRSSKAEIEDLIRARYSLIWVTSPEENRVEEALRKLCVEREMRLEVWSITEGFKTLANGQGTRDVKDPMKAIDHVIRAEGRALFILRDFHPFLKEPAVVRRLRDAATELRKTKKSLLVLSPIMQHRSAAVQSLEQSSSRSNNEPKPPSLPGDRKSVV